MGSPVGRASARQHRTRLAPHVSVIVAIVGWAKHSVPIKFIGCKDGLDEARVKGISTAVDGHVAGRSFAHPRVTTYPVARVEQKRNPPIKALIP